MRGGLHGSIYVFPEKIKWDPRSMYEGNGNLLQGGVIEPQKPWGAGVEKGALLLGTLCKRLWGEYRGVQGN